MEGRIDLLSQLEELLPVGIRPVQEGKATRDDGIPEEAEADAEGDALHEHVRRDEEGDDEEWRDEAGQSEAVGIFGERWDWGERAVSLLVTCLLI